MDFKMQTNYNIEDRIVEYTCTMIDIVEALPGTRAGNYIAGQMIRSCHSPAFNYGEAQAAESRGDFIHKLAIVLKELKECRIALKIVRKKEMIRPINRLADIYSETEALIAIIAKSINTAKKNKSIEGQKRP
jgi:four helix bundle protein